ncbi:MAG: hypothetical protein F6K48_02990 [Okeania sp. SIO3H1]|nr:hypothetical protein [Okeania sp. SIO3H1]
MSSRIYRRSPSDVFALEDDTDRLAMAGLWDDIPEDPKEAIPCIVKGLKSEQQVRRKQRENMAALVHNLEDSALDLDKRVKSLEQQEPEQKKTSRMVSEIHVALMGNKMGTTGLVTRMENVESDVRALKTANEADKKASEKTSSVVDTISKLWPIIATLIGLAGAAFGVAKAV